MWKFIKFGIVVVIVVGFVSFLFFTGTVRFNNPSLEEYPVWGVDVASYQGDIDWPKIDSQGVKFAFIKATEGSTFVDRCFQDNYNEATKTNIAIGAYHFFSYDSGGATQAENFIKTVPKNNELLPPVVDVEFYGDNKMNPLKKAEVDPNLKELLNLLEQHYGKKPIIYATQKAYNLYLEEGYEDYDIWIRNVFFKPTLDKHEWTFWQYADKGVLEGYDGEEGFIDLNVFNGSEDEFAEYLKK